MIFVANYYYFGSSEILIRVIPADHDEQIKLTRRLEVGAGMCLALKRDYGRAAGRSNLQANRELQGDVIGWFRNGYGGETEENSQGYFIPTNRGSYAFSIGSQMRGL